MRNIPTVRSSSSGSTGSVQPMEVRRAVTWPMLARGSTRTTCELGSPCLRIVKSTFNVSVQICVCRSGLWRTEKAGGSGWFKRVQTGSPTWRCVSTSRMSIMLIMMFLWVFLYLPTLRDTVSQPGRPVHMWDFPPSFFHSRTWNTHKDQSEHTEGPIRTQHWGTEQFGGLVSESMEESNFLNSNLLDSKGYDVLWLFYCKKICWNEDMQQAKKKKYWCLRQSGAINCGNKPAIFMPSIRNIFGHINMSSRLSFLYRIHNIVWKDRQNMENSNHLIFGWSPPRKFH